MLLLMLKEAWIDFFFFTLSILIIMLTQKYWGPLCPPQAPPLYGIFFMLKSHVVSFLSVVRMFTVRCHEAWYDWCLDLSRYRVHAEVFLFFLFSFKLGGMSCFCDSRVSLAWHRTTRWLPQRSCRSHCSLAQIRNQLVPNDCILEGMCITL